VIENKNSQLGAFLKNLIHACKLAFFWRVAEERIRVAWWQVAAWGLASLLIPVFYAIALTGWNGEFKWEAIPLATAHLPVILFAAIVVAYALGQSEKTLWVLQTFLMIAAAVDFVSYTTSLLVAFVYPELWARLTRSIYYLLFPPLWLAPACALQVAGLGGVTRMRRKIASAVCTVLLAVPLTWMVRDRSLWRETRQADQVPEAEAEELLDEDLFYNQREILQRNSMLFNRGVKVRSIFISLE
jgi:hypothetical protein